MKNREHSLEIPYAHLDGVIEVASLRGKGISVVCFTSETSPEGKLEVLYLILLTFTQLKVIQIIRDLNDGVYHNRLLYSAPFSPSLHALKFTHVIVTPESLCNAEFLGMLQPVYEDGGLNRLVVDEVRSLCSVDIKMLTLSL